MKKLQIILLAALFVLGFACKKESSESSSKSSKTQQSFVNKDLHFSVNFPSSDIDTMEIAGVYQYSCSDKYKYTVTVTQHPIELTGEQEIYQALEEYITGAGMMDIESEDKIKFKGNLAIRFKATIANMRVQGLIVFYNNYIYQLLVSDSDNYPPDDDAQKFFDSFEILKD